MHPAVSLVLEHALKYQHLFGPIALVALGWVAAVHDPVQHSLLVAAASWMLIWIPVAFRAGIWGGNSSSSGRGNRTSGWHAGCLLALGHICDRVPCDKLGVWTTKGLLPILVVLASEHESLTKRFSLLSYNLADENASEGETSQERSPALKSFRLLSIAAVSATAALATRFTTSSTYVLGLSGVIFTAVGLVLFEKALKSSKDDGDSRRGFVSANGSFSRRNSQGAQKEKQLASLRDVALVMAFVCAGASYFVEPPISSNAISWEPVYRQLRGDWKTLQYHRTVQQCLLLIPVNVIVNVLVFHTLAQQRALHTSLLILVSFMGARLSISPSFSVIWFCIISASASFAFLYHASSTSSGDSRNTLQLRRILFVVALVSFGVLFLPSTSRSRYPQSADTGLSFPGQYSPEAPLGPLPLDLKKGHPAEQLIRAAEEEYQKLVKRQSKTLAEAVAEYRRRNGISPPPFFDKWYEFAVRNGVQLIDEFDTVSRQLLPFWALSPSTIRERVRLALGNEENALIGVMIRDGNVVKVGENGQEWQQQATVGMMKEFVQYLPDMDLGFNIHDEPRVVVPNDQLAVLVRDARQKVAAIAGASQSPRNTFSNRPSDLSGGKRFDIVTTSRFNRFAHQQTWTHARLSCPMDTQARNYEDNSPDNFTSYAIGPLKYIYNQTAFSDICNSPSFATSFGFFERPNAFNIIHELTPVFSQSKISSFQDILYPSPWYWFGKVGYDEDRDTTWENKTNSLYWRGSTTGGFSRAGGWRRQHRQRIVRRLNALDKEKILVSAGETPEAGYKLQQVERRDYEKFIDVKFTHVGQCDPGDCDAQKEFFHVAEHADGQDAWYYKHLLDMDGNAFSGRFYAFLKSKSLTYKMAVFREWHEDWLYPWVHYIPISLNGTEHLDLVQWFAGGAKQRSAKPSGEGEKVDGNKGGNGDSIGERKAREIAERSTEWAGKVLRNVDFEVWFFRLLLEYGRIIDDDRDNIGYPGP